MQIKVINYKAGGMSLELVGESDVEYMVLRQIFDHGQMDRGNGDTKTPNGMATGFYLQCNKKETPLSLQAKIDSGELETPCGKTIKFDGEKYTFSNGEMWTPTQVHRVELQIAILDNDKRKYQSTLQVDQC